MRGRAARRRPAKKDIQDRVTVAPWSEAGPEGWPPEGDLRPVTAGYLALPMARGSLATADRYARRLAARGGEVMVVAEAQPAADRAWVEVLDAVGGLTAIATRHGLRLAVAPSADLERFLIGCEADLCLDIEQLREAGIDPLELIEAAPGRIRHVHMARVTPEVLAALRRHGYQGWITVEA